MLLGQNFHLKSTADAGHWFSSSSAHYSLLNANQGNYIYQEPHRSPYFWERPFFANSTQKYKFGEKRVQVSTSERQMLRDCLRWQAGCALIFRTHLHTEILGES